MTSQNLNFQRGVLGSLKGGEWGLGKLMVEVCVCVCVCVSVGGLWLTAVLRTFALILR